MFIFTTILGFITRQAIALWELKMRILGFILDHWKAAIVVLIAVVALGHYIGLKRAIIVAKSETIVAKKALIAYLKADNEAAVKREALNKLNAMLAQKKTDAINAAHKAELSMIIKKGKQNEIISNRDISNARSQLLHTVEGYEAKRLLENDTDRLASADDHATIFRQLQDELAVCKEAGAIAAADYNYCKSYVDIQQSVIGVQNEH